MKKLLIWVVALLAVAGCQNDNEGTNTVPPQITEVRNVVDVITSAARGTGIQIVGQGFAGTTAVKFNGEAADLSDATITGQKIYIIIPANAPTMEEGPVSNKIEVETPLGSASIDFMVLPSGPVVTGMSELYPQPGDELMLTGTGLLTVTGILFPSAEGLINVTDFTVNLAGTSITTVVPQGYEMRRGKIRVVTQSGSTVVDPQAPLPVIAEVWNASQQTIAFAAKGDVITIAGEHLAHSRAADYLVSVKMNGTTITASAITAEPTSLSFAIPSGIPVIPAAAAFDLIEVTTIGGTATYAFIVLPPAPAITGMTNTYPSGGEQIIIEGTNFFFVQSVKFPGVATPVTDFTVNAAGTEITLTTPAAFTPVEQNVEVNAWAGTATYQLALPRPTITGVQDGNGNTITYGYKNQEVVLQGRFFEAATSIVVNDVTIPIPSAGVTVTPTTIRFTIPAETKTRMDDIAIIPQVKLTSAMGEGTSDFYVMPYPELTVSNLTMGISYTYTSWLIQNNFQSGADPYVDRPTTTANPIVILPVEYEGTTLIRTAVDARAYLAPEYIARFTLSRQAEVCVIWNQGGDSRSIPWWLKDSAWTVDEEKIFEYPLSEELDMSKAFRGAGTTGTGNGDTFWAFRQTFPAGEVQVFRNADQWDPPGAGRNTNRGPYFILIK